MAVTNFGIHAHGFEGADAADALDALRALVAIDGEPVTLNAGGCQVRLPPKLVETVAELFAVIASKGNAAVFVVDEGRAFSLADIAKLLGGTRKQMYAAPDRKLLPLTASRQVKITDLLDLLHASHEATPDPEKPA